MSGAAQPAALAGAGVRVGAEALIAERAAALRALGGAGPVSALPGGFAVRKRGQGQVIADSRPYIQGDEMRHVDRGATARTGTLHVRTFHEERDRVSFLVADFRPSMLWGMRRALRSVAAAEALAYLGWQAVESGGRVGLLALTAGETVVLRSRGRLRGMLAVIGGLVRAHDRALAEARRAAETGIASADPPLDAMLTGLGRIVPRGASVIVASALDSRGAGFEAALGRLAQHRTPRFVLIEDAALQDLPAGHYPIRTPDGRRLGAVLSGQGAPAPRDPGIGPYEVIRVDAGRPAREALARAARG
ncbi:MAG: DUF58 domain-containing protein [Sedimentitalea sp.]|nr:DUF58 domain-containing protein [Sedimentitalea sp.]